MNPHTFPRSRILMPLFILGMVALLTLGVFALWNGILTDVLGVKAVTYWQALGILVLAKILFGGHPSRGHGMFGPRGRHMMMKHWESLTPEQREKMRETMRRRFGEWPQPPWQEMKEPQEHDKPNQP